jgi:hypothetical protein
MTGSANAPFLFFDEAGMFGFSDGIIRITLTATRVLPQSSPLPNVLYAVNRDRVVVAHLRISIPAAISLKDAIEGAILMSRPVAGGEQSKPN